jgi:hypothetical protein
LAVALEPVRRHHGPQSGRVRAALPNPEISLRPAERDDALGMLRCGLLDVAVIEAHTTPAQTAA